MTKAIGTPALGGLVAPPPAHARVVVVLNSGDATISLIDQVREQGLQPDGSVRDHGQGLWARPRLGLQRMFNVAGKS